MFNRTRGLILKSAVALCLLMSVGVAPVASAQNAASLKDAFNGSFLIGAALGERQFTGHDERAAALVQTQFNSISPENVLKWGRVHPRPDRYHFGPADNYVEFGETNGMFIIGHTLIWHNQTPRWVFQNEAGEPVDRETLLARMRDHIHAVVGRYKGRIKGWDVVNEAVNDDGTLRQSPWLRIIGEDYLLKAFQFAHEADPDAELYYNDFSTENAPKRNGVVKLLRDLLSKGAPINGVGIQEHVNLKWPELAELEASITAFAGLGLKVMITELDVDVLPSPTRSHGAEVSMMFASRPELNPYTNGLPDSVQQRLAERYADLFGVYLKHSDVISRVTFWGVTDRDSWLNNWPVRGRTSYPLLFDRDGQPKPAFDAVIKAVGR